MAEKTTATKPSSKSSVGVFDVAKPVKKAAAPTSRPVIVASRPIMQDPMMLSAATVAESVNRPSPSSVKVTIKPLAEPDSKQDAAPKSAAAKVSDTAKASTAIKISSKRSGLAEASLVTDDPGNKPSGVPFKKSAATAPEIDPEAIAAAATAAITGKPLTKSAKAQTDDPAEPAADASHDEATTGDDTPAEEPAAESTPIEPDAETTSSETTPDNNNTEETADDTSQATDTPAMPADDITAGADQNPDAKQAAELEAIAKQQAALHQLVESKEYFLPINSVEKRRSKLVTIFGIVLILALGLLLLDLLMDVGLVRINGVEPLTHFFSS